MDATILKRLGLTNNQSKIYLGFLKHGEKMASEIARKLSMDKSSAYRAVYQLDKKGLLTRKPRKRGTTYTAASPHVLKDLHNDKKLEIKKQSKRLNKFIKKLTTQAEMEQRKTYIKVEKGIDAHISAMEESLQNSEKIIRERWHLENPIFKNKKYSKYVFKFIKRRVKKKIQLKYLASWKDKSTIFDPIMKTSNKFLKEVRIIPGDIDDKNNLRIYDDTVEIISFDKKDEFIVITIKDEYIADLMKKMFDFIFDRGTIYHGKKVLPQKKLDKKISIPSLGIGSWGIGGYKTRNYYNDDQNDIDQLKHSIGKGQTYIDVSLSYAQGHSVDIIAKAIKNFPRKDLFINCKLTYNKEFKPLKTENEITEQCDTYLKRLGIGYLDSFEIHSPRAIGMLVSKAVKVIDKLIDKGKVRHLFVSNFSVDHLQKAVEAAKYKISAHEIHYNLIIRANEENGVVDFCNRNNILLIAYQPLRRGFMYTLENDVLISKLCKKYDKTPGQIAINWLVNKPNLIAICKSTNGSHINENAASLGWKMDTSDYEKLDDWRLPGYKTPKYDPTYKVEGALTVDKL